MTRRSGVSEEQIPLGLAEVDDAIEQRAAEARRVEVVAAQVEAATGNTGLADAIRHTPAEWRELAEHAVRQAARTGQPFTAYSLTRDPYRVPEPDHPNRWGALFSFMRRQGVVETTERGFTTSDRPRTAKSAVREWQGTPAWTGKGDAA